MKDSKKGFTLIELLAVIIILAVIALIAVPLVMATINDAKKGAAINSGYGLVSAIEHTLAVEMIQDTGANYASGSVTLSNGVYYFDGTKALSVSYKGNPATSVSLQVSNGVVVDGMITIDGFSLTVGSNGSIQTDGEGGITPPPVVEPGSYVVSSTALSIGDTREEILGKGVYLRSTPEEAMADWETISYAGTYPFYIKHVLNDDDEITKSYLEFVVTTDNTGEDGSMQGMNLGTYIMRGGDSGASYSKNKKALLDAFGNGHCEDYGDSYSCQSDTYFYSTAYADGSVNISSNGYHCDIDSEGSSSNCDFQ